MGVAAEQRVFPFSVDQWSMQPVARQRQRQPKQGKGPWQLLANYWLIV
jgi:hypothetical protein